MKEINISDVLGQAWELTKKHWATIIACLIGIWVVENLVSSIFSMGSAATMLAQLQTLDRPGINPAEQLSALMGFYAGMIPMATISNIINFILMVGTYQMLLNCGKDNGQFTLDAWKQPIGVYVKMFVTQIIVSIIVAVGTMLCILPGLYLYGRLQFAIYYLLDNKQAGIGDAISASWNMTSQSSFTLFGLIFVYVLIAIAGFLCCCVGIFVARIIIYFAIVVCYLTLVQSIKSPVATAPAEGTYNKAE